jgi:hypothetical protein
VPPYVAALSFWDYSSVTFLLPGSKHHRSRGVVRVAGRGRGRRRTQGSRGSPAVRTPLPIIAFIITHLADFVVCCYGRREEEKAKQTHFFVVSEDTAHSTRWAGFVEEVRWLVCGVWCVVCDVVCGVVCGVVWCGYLNFL